MGQFSLSCTVFFIAYYVPDIGIDIGDTIIFFKGIIFISFQELIIDGNDSLWQREANYAYRVQKKNSRELW